MIPLTPLERYTFEDEDAVKYSYGEEERPEHLQYTSQHSLTKETLAAVSSQTDTQTQQINNTEPEVSYTATHFPDVETSRNQLEQGIQDTLSGLRADGTMSETLLRLEQMSEHTALVSTLPKDMDIATMDCQKVVF